MANCDTAYVQAQQMRINNQGYYAHRFETDYRVTVCHWQAELICDGAGYSGNADGVWGFNSRRAVQVQMARYWGYRGAQDGAWGVNTWKAIQRMAAERGGYRGPIDGEPGRNTWQGIFFTWVPLD